MTQALLSDIGGVLIEDHWGLVAAGISTAFPVDSIEARRTLYRLCRPFDLGEESLQDLHGRFVAAIGEFVPWDFFRELTMDSALVLRPQVAGLYANLRRTLGVRIVAVSNMSETIWTALAAKFDLDEVFDAVILSSRCHSAKPDSAIFELAVQASGADADQCLFVDDSNPNVVGARALGIDGILVSGDPSQLRDLLFLHFPGLEASTGS